MEDAGLKTTDVGNGISDPTKAEEIESDARSNVLDEAVKQDVNGLVADYTVDRTIADTAYDSNAEVPDQDMLEPADSDTATDLGKTQDVTEDAKDEDAKQKDSHSNEAKILDVPVNDCSIAEEVEEKEDQNQKYQIY